MLLRGSIGRGVGQCQATVKRGAVDAQHNAILIEAQDGVLVQALRSENPRLVHRNRPAATLAAPRPGFRPKHCQLDLFDPNDGYFEYSAIVTGKPAAGRNLWFLMCGRGLARRSMVSLSLASP